jgi:alcohol dehydrogenase (cytochrome c)
MAVAGGSVYVATINVGVTSTTMSAVNGNAKAPGGESGDIEALSLATGKVEWDTKVSTLPLGATTVSNDLVFTTLYNGTLLALNRATGATVSKLKLPTSTNSPIAIAGNTVIVPAGGPKASATDSGNPQLVAYTVS